MLTVQVLDCSPALAVITTIPLFSAVTLPFWSTLAMVASPLDQVTVLSVVFSGITVAVSCTVSPMKMLSLSLLSVMLPLIGMMNSIG